MQQLRNTLTFAAGAVLMAVSSYIALTTFVRRISPNSVVIGYDEIDAVVTVLLFAAGSFLLGSGLINGINTTDGE